MKLTKRVVIPEKIEERCIGFKCDLCGSEDWSAIDFRENTHETTVAYKHGSYYPEGGTGVTLEFDICPKCFMEKLVPWFQSQGASPQEIDSDY